MDGSEKISFSLALSELVLDDAKVEIRLISWHFPVDFTLRLPPIFLLTSFIYVLFVVLEF